MKTFAVSRRPLALMTALFAVVALPLPLAAQDKAAPAPGTGDLEALLSGHTFPMNLKMKDLDAATWRRIKIGNSDKKSDSNLSGLGLLGILSGGNMGGMLGSILSGISTAGPDVYYTRGQMITLAGVTYLVAYQPETKEIDFGMLLLMKDSDTPPPPKPLTPDSPLVMSLLNLQTIGSLTGVRPVDMQAEIADSQARVKMVQELAKKPESSLAEPDLKALAPASASPAAPAAKDASTKHPGSK